MALRAILYQLIVLALLARGIGGQNASSVQADLVIVNARIWIGPEKPQNAPSAQPTAIAVVGDRIHSVGDDATVRATIGPDTRTIDARGRRVIPGMTDSHTHIVSGGLQLARLNLRDVRNREEFIQSLAAAKDKKTGEWVLGGRWSVESWADPKPPSKAWLDPVTGETPTFLERMDGHQALVNSAALRLANIDATGPKDPEGGEIERDPKTGEPTGILKESAADLVSRLIPNPSLSERYQALRRAMEHANSLGVTSVHNMSEPDDLEVFRLAHEQKALTIRVTVYLSVSDWPASIEQVKQFPIRDDFLRVAGFKGYMDGSLGSRTAYMRQPFSDAGPDTRYPRGQLNAMADPPESLREMAVKADAMGLQLAVHAIGDEANHLLLDTYEAVGGRSRRKDARHRVEHVQHLLVEDFARFAKSGVVASMQPYHKADDGRYAEKALGHERLKGSYAFRQLLDAGALLCFGSDFPVVTLDPFAGIDAAVNARTLAGEIWLPSHSLTLEEALRAYTVSPPKAIHQENRLGTIEKGKLADLLILAADPFDMPTERIGEVRVWQTIVGGKIVYTHPE